MGYSPWGHKELNTSERLFLSSRDFSKSPSHGVKKWPVVILI